MPTRSRGTTRLTPRADRLRARQVHRRAEGRQARGGDRAAQPLAPAAGARRAARRDHPKNILMIGPTGVGKTEIARRLAKLAQRPVRQGRGDEVHRGRLRRPRRRVDGPRPGRGRGQHGRSEERETVVPQGARARGGALARSAVSGAASDPGDAIARRTKSRTRRARSCARMLHAREPRRSRGRDRVKRASRARCSRSSRSRAWKRWT